MKAVRYTADAAKDLRRHGNMVARVCAAIAEYAADQNAHANNVTKLVGSTAKRMRIGNYRAILEESETDIVVTRIAPRGSAYEGT